LNEEEKFINKLSNIGSVEISKDGYKDGEENIVVVVKKKKKHIE